MLITCWYMVGLPFTGSVRFAIRCRCLVSRRSASSPLTFFMIPSLALCPCFLLQSCLFFADPVHNQPRAPLLKIIRGCGTNFIAFLSNFIAFFYNASVTGGRKCAHIYIYIYIYIYIQTLAQNWTAVIKISCLATLGNKQTEITCALVWHIHA